MASKSTIIGLSILGWLFFFFRVENKFNWFSRGSLLSLGATFKLYEEFLVSVTTCKVGALIIRKEAKKL